MQEPVVYTVAGMDEVHVKRDLLYQEVDGSAWRMDVYTPVGATPAQPLPAVLFIHGEVSPELAPGMKDAGQYRSWGRMVAARGMVGVTFSHRSTEEFTRIAEVASDVDAAFAYVRQHAAALGIDLNRIGIWTCSAGAYLGVRVALLEPAIRCCVAYYGLLDTAGSAGHRDELSPFSALQSGSGNTPLLLVRAGQDRPRINDTIDRFVSAALATNLPIEVINAPSLHHAFDVDRNDDTLVSSAIIRRTLDFLVDHLKNDPSPP